MASELKSSGAISIRKIIEGNRHFRVPLYQRNYKWGTTIAEKLAEDLIESYKKAEIEGCAITKSIGLLTLHQSGDNEYYIIDGQQRFITLSIIFSLLCDGKEKLPINLAFERDDENKTRINAIGKKYEETWEGSSTDEDRIMRNKAAISGKLKEIENKKAFKNYILDNCVMLCSVVEAEPEKEFMNLNAYKTRFSVCDYVRANLISLNSFYKNKLQDNNSLIASCLEKHSYKTAISHLYDDILDILYSSPDKKESDKDVSKDTYKNVYSVVKGTYSDPDITNESRINILFSKELPDTEKGYFSDEISKTVEEWIQMLLKLACAKKLLTQLKQEMENRNFSSAKEIDDYQKLKKKNFLDLVMNLDVRKEEIDTITLAKLLKENSNVGYVLMKELGNTDLKLANRYFESFVFSGINKPTVTSAEEQADDRIELPKMNDDEIVSCLQGAGQYAIAHFLDEQKQALDTSIVIAPVLDLEDRENRNFSEEVELKEGDTIAVGDLFQHNFKIPVIQRDYCMGARIANGKEGEKEADFLDFLLENFRKKKEVIASTILISVEKNTKDFYVFDGQQRLYTIYQLLKYGNNNVGDNKFTFVGRKNGASQYSKTAADKLQEALKARTTGIDLSEFRNFLLNNVKFKVKVAGTVSAAEQFFMDINGGVPLKNYEIFKSYLCNQLAALGKTDFIKKMENEWLNWFYRFWEIKRPTWSTELMKDDEEDNEELIEMRFIEFLCRFFIMKRENNKELPAFDCIDSKNELVGRLGYLEVLSKPKNDHSNIEKVISNIEKVMNYLTDHEEEIRAASDPNKLISYKETGDIYLGTSVVPQRIGYYLLEQTDGTHELQRFEFVSKYKNHILHQFIGSLSDERRKSLQKYYSWKNIGRLIEIYDADQLISDCILHISEGGEKPEEGKYPYAEKKNISMIFWGGYNVRKIELEGIPKEEIPAYYDDKQFSSYNYIRAKYLYDKVKAEEFDRGGQETLKLNFIWTKKRGEVIKKEDNTSIHIVFLNKYINRTSEIEWLKEPKWLMYETDAYFLNSGDVLYRLFPNGK